MSRYQDHGFFFQQITAANGEYRGHEAKGWDIPGGEHRESALPTSCKTLKTPQMGITRGVIGLASAKEWWEAITREEHLLRVGLYTQECDVKYFWGVNDYRVGIKYEQDLLGLTRIETVNDLEKRIRRRYQKGAPESAREFAKRATAWLRRTRRGATRLNAKITNAQGARLQCSISIEALDEIVEPEDKKVHRETYGKILLPIGYASSEREFRESRNEVETASQLNLRYTPAVE